MREGTGRFFVLFVCFGGCFFKGWGGGGARDTTLTAHLLPALYLSYGSSRVNVNNEYV